MVNAPKKNFSPLAAGRYSKLAKQSTQRRHQVNEGKSGLDAEGVGALGALRSLRSKKMLAAEKRREMHFLSNQEKEKWIEDYVTRETAVARMRVQDPAAAVQQRQDDMKHDEIAGLMYREPEKTFEEIVTGGVRRRWCECCWTELEVRIEEQG